MNYKRIKKGNTKPCRKTYKKLYRIIGKSTPLYGDCGLLCDNKCCEGDSNTGMILFPGEEKLFDGKKHKDFTLSSVNLDKNTKATLLACNGTCNRDKRPLSCRIFPYLPVIKDKNTIKIIRDPRAYSICPLVHLKESDFHGIKDENFEKRLIKAFSYLLKFESINKFLSALEINSKEYKKLRDKFLNNK